MPTTPRWPCRLICWFPPGAGTVVVALYATDKAKLGRRVLRRGGGPRRPDDRPVEARDCLRGEAMTEDPTPQAQATFVRGTEHLDRLLADPQIAADVAQAHAEAEEMDRVYAMNLAMIRKAAQLTQVEVAKRARRRSGRRLPHGEPRRHAPIHSVRLPHRHWRRRRQHRRCRSRPAHRAGPRLASHAPGGRNPLTPACQSSAQVRPAAAGSFQPPAAAAVLRVAPSWPAGWSSSRPGPRERT